MKTFIENRSGTRIAVVVSEAQHSAGLAFVMHGLRGFKEQLHVEAMRQAFEECGYVTVTFDARDTLGESEGNYENATTTGYLQDLEDVIAWSKRQSWYQEPFVLAGHSIGGMCVALYAQQHSTEIKAVAPIAATISADSYLHLEHDEEEIARWKATGWRISESRSKPGVVTRLKWNFVEDIKQYDLLPRAGALTMPVLVVVSSGDAPESQNAFFDRLPGPKVFRIIEGADHNFRSDAWRVELKETIRDWAQGLKK